MSSCRTQRADFWKRIRTFEFHTLEKPWASESPTGRRAHHFLIILDDWEQGKALIEEPWFAFREDCRQTAPYSLGFEPDIATTIGTHLSGPTPGYPPSLALMEAEPTVREAQAAPEKRGWTGDFYTISEDGHFIGQDGFVVPRSFEEFFGRHPRYVRGRVSLCWPNGTDSEREDHESELLIFLMSLPDKSRSALRVTTASPTGVRTAFRPSIRTLPMALPSLASSITSK
jgi:hypothetical protein